MNRRDGALRLKRFQVQDLGRRLAALDGMRADLERKLADLEESVARERQRCSDTDIGRLAFPSFLQSIESRRTNITNSLNEIKRERAHYDAELTIAFEELKALELALKHALSKGATAESHRTRSRADELTLMRHLRKHAVRQA